MEVIINKLESNSDKTKRTECVRLLTKIIDNILQRPKDTKLRTLKRDNLTVREKILAIDGGIDCLQLIGFHDNGDELMLPIDAPLDQLVKVKEQCLKLVDNQISLPKNNNNNSKHNAATSDNHTAATIKPQPLPVSQAVSYSNSFIREVNAMFNVALIYKYPSLLAKARQLIPKSVKELAEVRLKNYEAAMMKVNEKADTAKGAVAKDGQSVKVSLQEMELLELLRWFKEDFFTWVDSPDCQRCGAKTRYERMSDEPRAISPDADRVELHRCTRCDAITPFPRHNDLHLLLGTRRGRCGEWANCFTLMCRAYGYDARIVHCKTDHAWAEVYCNRQRRWLHCDPCEMVCDNPLMYEHGWNKQLTYVMAYGADDVQDVTWRYTSNHADVRRRRRLCDERELARALFEMNAKRQQTMTETRRMELTRRCLDELVEFLTERKPTSEAQKGRTSGSLDWRLARNEINVERIAKRNEFVIDGLHPTITIRYNSSMDDYEQTSGDETTKWHGWESMVYECEGIFRKVERDWRMAYLCRQESVEIGRISWMFRIRDDGTARIRTVDVVFHRETFETGRVDVDVEIDGGAANESPRQIDSHVKSKTFEDLNDCKWIKITARLTGGVGTAAWQHAQLFRQELSDVNYPFAITIGLNK